MDRIWHSAFDTLWQLLLDLLGHDRSLASIFGVTPRRLRVRVGRCVISLCWVSMIDTRHDSCRGVLRFSLQRQRCDQGLVPTQC
jgi:hypothetical protein